MKKGFEYNLNIYGIICDRQRHLQSEVGTDWWYRDSLFHKIVGIVGIVAFAVTVLWNFIVISGYAYRLSLNAEKSNWANERAIINNSMRSFIIGSVICIAAYFLRVFFRNSTVCKKTVTIHFVSAILLIVGCALLIITSYNALIVSNIDNLYAEAVDGSTPFKVYCEFIFLHLLPLLLLAVGGIFMYIMHRCDYKEKDSLYKRLTETLYAEFSAENPAYSEKQWNDFLDGYKGFPDDKLPTRSEKSRKRKHKTEE